MFRVMSGAAIFAAFFLSSANAQVPPIEAYGNLPTVRSMDLSPDGNAVAYLLNQDGNEAMAVYDFNRGPIATVGTGGLKTYDVDFVGPDHAVIYVSEFKRRAGFRGKFDNNAAFSISLEKQDPVMLAKNTPGIFPAQTALGNVIGRVRGEDEVFMAVFMGDDYDSNPPYSLLKVDLNNGQGRVHEDGIFSTSGWMVNPDGVVMARIDYNNDRDYFAIRTNQSGSWETVYEDNEARLPPFSVVGYKADESSLIIVDQQSDGDYNAVYELGWDGSIGQTSFARDDADIEGVVRDLNGAVYGYRYSGLYPSYDFYDSGLDTSMQTAAATFPDSSVFLVGASDDWATLLLRVTGGNIAGEYYRFNRATLNMTKVADEWSGIPRSAVAEVNVVEYKARDDLKIPSLITWPLGAGERANLPLIVMPHGGPEAYDSVRFDWMAQYFASRGYAVLQPNFRGSDGFGASFRLAGRGEWGLKMQDDVTDGVNALVKIGVVDPERVCIVGGSYGGYSALAGGAFTPDLYKCVVAIAPVSDLPRMLNDTSFEYGSDHWVMAYWEDVIGNSQEDREKLRDVSPANHADKFQAPVLLIHGKDDTVVPLEQSLVMERALRSAGKDVELVRLNGEDHYLSVSETRLATLRAMDAFIREHLPVD